MEEQKEHSTSTSSTSKEGRGGGGRGDGVVKEGADDKKQLSPATIVEDDHDRKQMEVGRLINNEDLVLSNIRDRLRPRLNSSDCKATKRTSTSSSSTSQVRVGRGDVSRTCKRRSAAAPVMKVDDDDEERAMKMAHLAREVFSNNLITDKMWPHLNFADLKATRQVSRDFNQTITSFRGFKNSVVLQVTKESLEVPGLFDKNASSMAQTWHGIQIDVDLPLDVLDKIRHILEHVQFVSFVISRETLEDSKFDFRDGNYSELISGVLSSTPKLTALQMDVQILENDLRQVWWSSAIIRDNLKNLESLELSFLGLVGDAIDKAMIRSNGTYRRAKEILYYVHLDSAGNLEQLATALAAETKPPPRLKRLRFPKSLVDLSDLEEIPRPEIGSFTRSVLQLLRSHRDTLVEVSITVCAWEASEYVRTLNFPQLRSLTSVSSGDSVVNFESFLMRHPKLEELDLSVIDFRDYEDEDMDLWKAIKRRCAAAGAYLKKLHLKTSRYYWTCFEASLVLDWSFLEEMKTLEDFQVEVTFDSLHEVCEEGLGIGPRVLECLPRNQLTSLSLKGLHFGGSFWRVSPEDREDSEEDSDKDEGPEPAVVVVEEEVPLAAKLDLLRGFQNLKRLSFRLSKNAVDDDILQFIFREMSCLEELEVSHCCRLTDVGIAGSGPEKESERVSIQSLKELKVLSIRLCPLVTPEGLLSVLALPFLHHFDYYTRTPVPKSFVCGIAAQNPSLESISVHIATGDSDEPPKPSSSSTDIDHCAWSAEEKRDFFDKHPRIKAIHNLEVLGRDGEYAPDDDSEED